MGDYGSEFVNLAFALREISEDGDVFPVLETVLAGDPRIIYLAPRRYFVRLPPTRTSFELVIPEGVELRFAPNAWLDPGPGVTIVIRGSIRAGAYQIFGIGQGVFAPTDPPDLVNFDSRRTAPAGLIRIESLEVTEIFPEWWGAIYTPTSANDDSSSALQACLNTAVRDRTRDGRPLPPLTVLMQSQYRVLDTLRVEAPPGLPGVLWMKGYDPISHGGMPGATLSRATSQTLSARGRTDLDCLLDIGPRVSVKIQEVSFKVLWSGVSPRNAADRSLPDEVAVGVHVRRERGEGDRSLIFERCGFQGSREACVKVEPSQERSGPLRASFFQCVFNTHVTDLVATSALPFGAAVRTANALRLDLAERDNVSFSENWFRGIRQDAFRKGVPPPGAPIDLYFQAGIDALGGSLFVRGSTFHFGDGPRPSRPNDPTSGLAPFLADGQDIWLRASRSVPSTQLTVLHAESQSWWFLGAERTEKGDGDAAVVLIAYSGGNVQWGEGLFRNEYLAAVRASVPGVRFDANDAARHDPPPVIWPGGATRLVTVGCRFRGFVALAQDAKVYDIGSTFEFRWGGGDSLPTWLSLSVVPRPPEFPPVLPRATDAVRVHCLPPMNPQE